MPDAESAHLTKTAVLIVLPIVIFVMRTAELAQPVGMDTVSYLTLLLVRAHAELEHTRPLLMELTDVSNAHPPVPLVLRTKRELSIVSLAMLITS